MSATYGDLVGRAGVDIHTGLLHVMRRGFVDQRQAQNTVGAYYDLIAALRSHTWWLIDPARARTAELGQAARGMRASDDFDVLAAAVFAGYGPLKERPVWLPSPEPDFDHPWRDAADKIGAATDLLETHLGPHREPRSEQAALVLDPGQRRGALDGDRCRCLADQRSGVGGLRLQPVQLQHDAAVRRHGPVRGVGPRPRDRRARPAGDPDRARVEALDDLRHR